MEGSAIRVSLISVTTAALLSGARGLAALASSGPEAILFLAHLCT